MPDRFLLLTGDFDVGGYVELLQQLNPTCGVEWLRTQDDLLKAIPAQVENVRLVCLCTSTIVPRSILDRLGAPAYNIHPGPPNYPGSNPESWAAYFGATEFGATLHVMAPRVDEGAIIDTNLFAIWPGIGQIEIAERAFHAAAELLMRWTPSLIGSDLPLPLNGQRWGYKKWRRRDKEEISRIPLDIEMDELEKRRRAFAEAPPGRLTITLGGLVFTYSPAAVCE